MMSDDDRDIDIESDEDDSDSRSQPRQNANSQYFSQAEKRAHHNALERKRRDHIKDSFSSLRDSVPSLQGEKVVMSKASRAQILKKAAEYIQFMRRKNTSHQHDIDDLKRQNNLLEAQIRTLEKARATGNFAAESSENGKVLDDGIYHSGEAESDTSDTDGTVMPTMPRRGNKKIKIGGVYH